MNSDMNSNLDGNDQNYEADSDIIDFKSDSDVITNFKQEEELGNVAADKNELEPNKSTLLDTKNSKQGPLKNEQCNVSGIIKQTTSESSSHSEGALSIPTSLLKSEDINGEESDLNSSLSTEDDEAQLEKLRKILYEKKEYKCNFCDKKFSRTHDLKRHLLLHTGEKPFSCSLCDKSFRLKSVLEKHKFSHSEGKSVICNYCNKMFKHKSYLERHQTIHNIEIKLECDVCNDIFKSKSELNEHKRLHNRNKVYLCEKCNKTFSKKSNLMRHKLIHEKEGDDNQEDEST